MNERNTEDIVREIFKTNKNKFPAVTIYEQKTNNPRIEKALKNASKQGHGTGKPEFIVTFHNVPELILVVECKADPKKHESRNRDNFKDCAVDGVLLYSSYLSKEFDVVSIAVSGETKSQLQVSNFLQIKNTHYTELVPKKILDFDEYLNLYKKDPEKEKADISKLMRYSKKLHNDLRDFAKLSEQEKPLLVSAILIALTEPSFVSSYAKKTTSKDLVELMLTTIKEVLEHAKLPNKKIESMLFPYEFIRQHQELTREYDKDGNPVALLRNLIKDVEENVRPFVKDYTDDDALGRFYGEFLRYSGGDKKGLGIVLTPKHITGLFVKLADVKKDDVVFDNCCGTGGFLISAMKRMIDDAKGDNDKIDDIKSKQLIGVESLSNMFALACANMILRGDGKANLYKDDCFDVDDTIIQKHKLTVGLLNPPYSQKGEGLGELNFVLESLRCLEKNSICIAIVPLNCATAPSQQKIDLLKEHTLEAVMSVPNELFQPMSSVVTCIMVFKAKVPHNFSKEVWFGYWKDDGYVKTKHEGRIDKNKKWADIEQRWLDNFLNRKEVKRESVLHKVKAEDEWCAEAYMKTDYSEITQDNFLNSLKEYVIFHILNSGVNID